MDKGVLSLNIRENMDLNQTFKVMVFDLDYVIVHSTELLNQGFHHKVSDMF